MNVVLIHTAYIEERIIDRRWNASNFRASGSRTNSFATNVTCNKGILFEIVYRKGNIECHYMFLCIYEELNMMLQVMTNSEQYSLVIVNIIKVNKILGKNKSQMRNGKIGNLNQPIRLLSSLELVDLIQENKQVTMVSHKTVFHIYKCSQFSYRMMTYILFNLLLQYITVPTISIIWNEGYHTNIYCMTISSFIQVCIAFNTWIVMFLYWF